ncbi:hypothetical protein EU642_22150 [Salmonella enterica]|nr:hypothetical protein [Salmonella enterica]EAR6391555.1 hypothetical protein [Salmonella enterica]EAV1285319.1 hypothetical protein [Salmonella enterica]
MKSIMFCPYCRRGGTTITFKRNHFDNCIFHTDPDKREAAIKRHMEALMQCEKCGFISTVSVIKSHHNEFCRNMAIVAKELATGRLTYYRWMHHTQPHGFKQDFIRQVLEGRRNSTNGHTFRAATPEEIAASLPLSPDGFPDIRERGVALWRIGPNGAHEYFASISKAAAATPGATPQKISEVMTGERKTHAGFQWRRDAKPRKCGVN